MSKYILSTILLVIVPVTFLSAQSSTNDPFNWTAPIDAKSYNMFMLWSQKSGNGSTQSYQKVYNYIVGSGVLPSQDRFNGTQNHLNSSANVEGNHQMDVASGYFTKSVYENVVAAWEGPNQTIQIMIPHFDSTENRWSSTSDLTVQGPVVPYGGGQRGRIYVRTGDFLGNGVDQFVLGYQGADSTIHLQVYSVDDNLTPHLIASVNDEELMPTPTELARFSITTGDLNGDGQDEIILDGVEQNYNGSGNWAIYTKIYEVDNSSILPKARRIVFTEPRTYSVQAPKFGSTAGSFIKNSKDQVAFVSAVNQSNGNNAYVFKYILESSQDLSTITYDSTKVDSTEIGTTGSITSFSISAGDLNKNGRDELVYDLNDIIYVYSTDDSSNLNYRMNLGGLSGGPEDDQLSYDYMAVGDLNEDEYDDIVVEKDIYGNGTNHFLQLAAYSVNESLNSDSTLAIVSTDTVADNGAGSYFHYALALGNFDGRSFHIGKPKHSELNNVTQPIVILNAPPIHFDVLNGTTYDLNNCFSGVGCDFYAEYTKSSSDTKSVQTVIHNSFNVGAGIDASGAVSVAPEGIGASANFELKFEITLGADWETQQTIKHTVHTSDGVKAIGDDEIFATITSYDMWEYPLYQGTDPTPYNYYLLIKPKSSSNEWFSAKSYNSRGYVPNHETGNILSYASTYDSLNKSDPEIVRNIYPVYQAAPNQVNNSKPFHFELQMSDFQQTITDSSWNAGVDFKRQALTIVEAHYKHSEMNTQTTSIRTGIDLYAHGGLMDSLGEVAAYVVKPYVYQSKDGAFVLNYAVNPDTASVGQSPTWWQQEYGHAPDPTFVLPWFYDPEKGIVLSEEAKRYNTTDISFSDPHPTVGNKDTISTRIRNYSLVDTPTPVSVRFYIGDPNNGGIPLINANGDTVATSTGVVKVRGYTDIKFPVIIPSSVPSSLLYGGNVVRIYAVIDPGNTISEIHEDNNMGWSVLNISGITTAVEKNPNGIPTTVKLFPNYPNPFNPTTTIHYVLPKAGNVALTVYNVLGQRVAQLVDSRQTAGNHEIRFNASQLSSGVYFYRLQANNVVRTGKMMLIK